MMHPIGCVPSLSTMQQDRVGLCRMHDTSDNAVCYGRQVQRCIDTWWNVIKMCAVLNTDSVADVIDASYVVWIAKGVSYSSVWAWCWLTIMRVTAITTKHRQHQSVRMGMSPTTQTSQGGKNVGVELACGNDSIVDWLVEIRWQGHNESDRHKHA